MKFLQAKIEAKKDTFSLVWAIVFLIIGVMLMKDSKRLMNLVSYIIGGAIILFGLVRLFMYLKHKKEEPENYNNLIIAIMAMIFGIVAIIFIQLITDALRIIMVMWLIYSGIIKLILSFKLKELIPDKWTVTLFSSIVMIVCGLCILIFPEIFSFGAGIIFVLYSIIEIVQYIIVPKDKNPDIIK